jgi:hypothetical protein
LIILIIKLSNTHSTIAENSLKQQAIGTIGNVGVFSDLKFLKKTRSGLARVRSLM